MADRYSTGRRAGLRLITRVVRGSLVHQIGAVAFREWRRAVCEWSALHAYRAEAQRDGDAL